MTLSKKEYALQSEKRRRAMKAEQKKALPTVYKTKLKTKLRCIDRAKEISEKDNLNHILNHNSKDAKYFEGVYGTMVNRLDINMTERNKKSKKLRFGTYESDKDLYYVSDSDRSRTRFIPPKKG